MDPTFNDRKDLRQVCETIQKHNPDGVLSFHTELRADLMGEEMADLFTTCHFKTVEVGLQSVNPEAIKKVGRRNNLDRFLKGVHLLKERDIHVTVGIIIGLPGDNLSTVAETVKFLLDHQAYSDVQVFNLSVLPGTVLRTQAEKLGLKYQPDPPYYVLETETRSGADLRKAQEYCAEKLGIDIDPIEFPFLSLVEGAKVATANQIDSISKVILELDTQIQSPSQMKQLAARLKDHIANCFTAWFKSHDLTSDVELIETFLFPIVQANPHTIFNVILETDNPFLIELLGEILAYAVHPGQFLNSYYLFCSYEEDAIFSTQVTVLLPLDRPGARRSGRSPRAGAAAGPARARTL
ncbi:MAG: radical SAM protein, partial [Nitrospira sp.]|nr:radical SAM protein [Nitrospira sp.]